MSWKNCVTPELKQRRHLRTGVGALFLIGSSMPFTHGLHRMLFALSPFPRAQPSTEPCCTLRVPREAQLRVSLRLRVLVKVSHTTCGILCWSCYFTRRLVALSNRLLMKLTWLSSHSLVILPLIYFATRKVFTILHDATLGTIARGVCSIVAPDVLRDIPDETVKALVDCLVITIFLAVTTTTVIGVA